MNIEQTQYGILNLPEKELETIRVLMIEALDKSNKCECLSCKGLQVLANRIVKANTMKCKRCKKDVPKNAFGFCGSCINFD